MDGLPPNQIKRRAKHRNEAAKGGKDCRIENIPLRTLKPPTSAHILAFNVGGNDLTSGTRKQAPLAHNRTSHKSLLTQVLLMKSLR